MKFLFRTLAFTLVCILFFHVILASSQEKQEKNAWTGKLRDGTVITKEDLDKIVTGHKKWIETDGKEGQRADLERADLTRASLTKASLTKANLWEANLTNAQLGEANLSKAYLQGANLSGANLSSTNLSEANLSSIHLDRSVILKDANLQGAKLWNVILSGNITYEPKSERLPYIPSMATVWGLSSLTFEVSSHGLVELREAFKKAGLRRQEREITYALKRTETRLALKKPSELSILVGSLHFILFDMTCQYGMNPGRPLLILTIILIPLFSLPYIFVLSRPGPDGIWMVWLPDRMRKDLGERKPVRLHVGWLRALRLGLYFSILSAFNIGWRELNVGNWIARIQPYEYTFRATGKVRVISGIQSLVSVYLLALSVLSYFGRPFEW